MNGKIDKRQADVASTHQWSQRMHCWGDNGHYCNKHHHIFNLHNRMTLDICALRPTNVAEDAQLGWRPTLDKHILHVMRQLNVIVWIIGVVFAFEHGHNNDSVSHRVHHQCYTPCMVQVERILRISRPLLLIQLLLRMKLQISLLTSCSFKWFKIESSRLFLKIKSGML